MRGWFDRMAVCTEASPYGRVCAVWMVVCVVLGIQGVRRQSSNCSQNTKLKVNNLLKKINLYVCMVVWLVGWSCGSIGGMLFTRMVELIAVSNGVSG